MSANNVLAVLNKLNEIKGDEVVERPLLPYGHYIFTVKKATISDLQTPQSGAKPYYRLNYVCTVEAACGDVNQEALETATGIADRTEFLSFMFGEELSKNDKGLVNAKKFATNALGLSEKLNVGELITAATEGRQFKGLLEPNVYTDKNGVTKVNMNITQTFPFVMGESL